MSEGTTLPSVRHRRPVTSLIDKWLFIGFVILGSCLMLYMKHLMLDQLYVTAVPVISLITYAVYVLSSKRFYLREDRAGDNLYYMGFLFTLVSLGHALFVFDIEGRATGGLIQDFGIALASTILGLSLRIFVNQFREDPVEVEREARLELTNAVQQLKSQLHQAVLETNSYHRTLKQSTDEAISSVTTKAGQTISKSTSDFEKVTGKLIDGIDKIFSEHASSAKQLSESSHRTVKTLEKLVDRIEKVKAPEDLVTRKVEPAFDKMDNLISKFEAREKLETEASRKTSESIDRAAQIVGSMEVSYKGLKEASMEFEGIAHKVRDAIVAIETSTAPLRRTIELQEASLKSFEAGMDGSVERLKRHNEGLEAELRKAREANALVFEHLASLAETIVERLGAPARQRETGTSDVLDGPNR